MTDNETNLAKWTAFASASDHEVMGHVLNALANRITASQEAVRVLANAANTPMAWKLRTCPECQKIRDDIANNPITTT